MKQAADQLLTEEVTAEREWSVDGIPILTASISLPRPVRTEGRAAARIDRYYRMLQRSYLLYCERMLFPQSAEAYWTAIRNSTPLPRDTAALSYRVTWNHSGIWSLYTQTRESIGQRRAELLRRGDTWDLLTGYPLALPDFFPRHSAWKKRLRAAAQEEILRREAAGLARYQEDWRHALRDFNPQNFYLTAEGLCFFYQMHTIAPATEGIPVFCLPFSPEGPRLPGAE